MTLGVLAPAPDARSERVSNGVDDSILPVFESEVSGAGGLREEGRFWVAGVGFWKPVGTFSGEFCALESMFPPDGRCFLKPVICRACRPMKPRNFDIPVRNKQHLVRHYISKNDLLTFLIPIKSHGDIQSRRLDWSPIGAALSGAVRGWAMVDIRLMQAAVAVAEELSFSRAADRLNITQPALSKQISELEDRVGHPLFDRSTQSVTLTDAGAAFVEHARVSLAAAERAVHDARVAAFGSEAMLSIGKTPYADPYITAAMISVRLPLFTNLHVRFSSHYSSESIKLLRSGELDLAVVMGLHEYAGVTASTIGEEPLYVALCSSDSLCSKRELTLGDLGGRPWAVLERIVNHSLHDRLHKAAAEDGVHPTEVQHILQAEEAAALILQNDSIALLPKFSAWRISDGIVTLRPLRDERLMLKTFLVARPDESSRLVAEFVKATIRRLKRTPMQGRLALVS